MEAAATSEPILITFSGAYGLDRLEKTIATLRPMLEVREPTLVHIDFSRLVHISPTSLALVIATLKRVQDDGLLVDGSMIFPPNSTPVRRYVERMNLLRELVGSDLEEDFERHKPHGFRPCEHFSTDEDYVAVARSMANAIVERCNVDDTAKGAIRICLDEVCENVIHHADSEHGGFAAAQGWPAPRTRAFEVAIVDLGRGIRASLTQNKQYAHIQSDAEAIEAALQPRVTATPERNAGIGLFVTSLLLIVNGGHLIVRSGQGRVRRGADLDETDGLQHLPGTVVAIRASIDRPLDLKPVYEALEKSDAESQGAPSDADNGNDDFSPG